MTATLRHCLVLLIYLAGWVAFTWPNATLFTTRFLHEGGDGWVNVWNLWWVRTALLELHANPWWCDWIYHPDGVTLLAQSLTPVNGLLSIPLHPLLGDVATYNTLVVLGFVLTGWTTFLLARHLTGDWLASVCAGAAVTFSHWHFAHAVGHLPQVTLQFLPLFVLAWLRLLEAPGVARGLLAGGALTLNLLTDLYFVLFCVLLAVPLFVHEAVRRRDALFWLRAPALRGLLAFTAVALATVGTFTFAFVTANARDPFQFSHEPLEFSSDLLDAFVPGFMWKFAHLTESWHWERHKPFLSEFDVYLGYALLLLAALGVWRGRARGRWIWLVLAALGFAIALGPGLHVAGKFHRQVPMPYGLLELVFPPLRTAGVPARTMILTTIALAMLAAYGIAALGSRARRWLLVLLPVFWLEVWPCAIWTQELRRDDVIAALARLPEGAAFEPRVSLEDGLQSARQTLHERKLPLAYISRAPLTRARRIGESRQLLDEGRYAELMRRYQLRYLVLPNAEQHPGLAELAPVHRGATDTIHVLRDDPLAAEKGR